MSRQLFTLAFALLVVHSGFDAARAEDSPVKAIEALRDEGKYDQALAELTRLESDLQLPDAVRERLQFERGVTLIQGASRLPDDAGRVSWLTNGAQAMQTFLDQQVDSPLVVAAHVQIGNAQVELARRALKRSERVMGEPRTAELAESRKHYGRALGTFEKIVQLTADKLDFSKLEGEPRAEAQRDLLQGKLLIAATTEESAETFTRDSAEQREALTKAASLYEEVGQKYRTRLAGLYAQMFQGRCLQKLGRHADSLVIFETLLANPDEPGPFRDFRIRVLEIAADSWLAEKKFQQAIDKIQPVLESVKDTEKDDPRIVTLREKLAAAKKGLDGK